MACAILLLYERVREKARGGDGPLHDEWETIAGLHMKTRLTYVCSVLDEHVCVGHLLFTQFTFMAKELNKRYYAIRSLLQK